MEFRCERDVLVDALSSVSRAVSSRGGALPVLSGVRTALEGDRLDLLATDLDLTIRVGLDVGGLTDGSAVLPARLTADIVRSLEPGAVHVRVVGEEAHIAAGRSQFSVRLLPLDDFPRLAEPSGDEVRLSSSLLSDALRQVVRAASHDDARPILTGVLLAAEAGGLRLVATDSYRLALRDLPGTSVLAEGQSVLVPSRSLGELQRLLGGGEEVVLRLGERDASFTVGDATLVTRLIEGEFPNYRQLIPDVQPNRLVIGRDPMLDAIRRVRLLAREGTPLRMTMQEDRVELTAIDQDLGQAHEDVDGNYDGEPLIVAFNPEYLADGIEAVTGDEVQLHTIDALKPAVIRSAEGDDFLYLLMPVRVS